MGINKDPKGNVDKILWEGTIVKTSTYITLIGINVTILYILIGFIILNLIGKYFLLH